MFYSRSRGEMPHALWTVEAGVAHPVTWRAVDLQRASFSDGDRNAYLGRFEGKMAGSRPSTEIRKFRKGADGSASF